MAKEPPVPLAAWPVRRPPDWADLVNAPLDESQLAAARLSVNRGRPWGDAAWIAKIAAELGLAHTLRRPGRPRKTSVEVGE